MACYCVNILGIRHNLMPSFLQHRNLIVAQMILTIGAKILVLTFM